MQERWKDDSKLVAFLAYGACVLAVIAWVLSILSNIRRLRIIPAPNMICVALPLQIMLIIIKVLLTAAYMYLGLYTIQIYKETSPDWSLVYLFLLYKGLKRVYSAPLASAFELSFAMLANQFHMDLSFYLGV